MRLSKIGLLILAILCIGWGPTYKGDYDGEYNGDTDKACQDDGATNVDGTAVGTGAASAAAAINGSYGVLVTDDNAGMDWALTAGTLDTATGTIRIKVHVPVDIQNALTPIGGLYANANNHIMLYHDNDAGSNHVTARIRFAGTYDYVEDTTQGLDTVATDYTVCYTWDIPNQEHSIHVAEADTTCPTAGNWNRCQNAGDGDALGAMDAEIVEFFVGEDSASGMPGESSTTDYYFDDVQVRSGYEGNTGGGCAG
jgi:hypothetical protein